MRVHEAAETARDAGAGWARVKCGMKKLWGRFFDESFL